MLPPVLRRFAKRIVQLAAPELLHKRHIRLATLDEKETGLLPLLCRHDRISVDVGANRGLYVHHLLPVSREVWAFEPHPAMFGALKARYGQRAKVLQIALSDAPGTAVLRLPPGNVSWASISPENAFELADASAGLEEVSVETRTLDSFALSDLGLLKIDVEGHEEAVLRGAIATLRSSMPNIVVEVEERHSRGAVERIKALLAGLGYSGFFLSGDGLRPMSEFSVARHQPIENVSVAGKTGTYINNFVFVPESFVATLVAGSGT